MHPNDRKILPQVRSSRRGSWERALPHRDVLVSGVQCPKLASSFRNAGIAYPQEADAIEDTLSPRAQTLYNKFVTRGLNAMYRAQLREAMLDAASKLGLSSSIAVAVVSEMLDPANY